MEVECKSKNYIAHLRELLKIINRFDKEIKSRLRDFYGYGSDDDTSDGDLMGDLKIDNQRPMLRIQFIQISIN